MSDQSSAQLNLQPVSAGDVHQQDFREAMALLSAAVCVVTAGQGPGRTGRTVTAGFSLGIAPPTLLVSIDESARLTRQIRADGSFSHAVLSNGQTDVADAFAGKTPAERRFDIGNWGRWPSGLPRLEGAVAALDCAVVGEVALAGHVLFVGAVRGIVLNHLAQPLIWHARRYHTVGAI